MGRRSSIPFGPVDVTFSLLNGDVAHAFGYERSGAEDAPVGAFENRCFIKALGIRELAQGNSGVEGQETLKNSGMHSLSPEHINPPRFWCYHSS